MEGARGDRQRSAELSTADTLETRIRALEKQASQNVATSPEGELLQAAIALPKAKPMPSSLLPVEAAVSHASLRLAERLPYGAASAPQGIAHGSAEALIGCRCPPLASVGTTSLQPRWARDRARHNRCETVARVCARGRQSAPSQQLVPLRAIRPTVLRGAVRCPGPLARRRAKPDGAARQLGSDRAAGSRDYLGKPDQGADCFRHAC
jgi:hypothetical protein